MIAIADLAAEEIAKALHRKQMREMHGFASDMHEALAAALLLEETIDDYDDYARNATSPEVRADWTEHKRIAQDEYYQEMAKVAAATAKCDPLRVALGLPLISSEFTMERK